MTDVVLAARAHSLVDRLRIMVFPQIPGETGEPFLTGLPDINLRLGATKVLDNRLVLLEYLPEPPG